MFLRLRQRPVHGVKVAVTVVDAASVTVHAPTPLQPPPAQPTKVEPSAGVAASWTMVPAG
jgi:hypothetical protein